MREEDARIEEHAIAQLAHLREELARPGALVEEPERAARLAGAVAARGLHAALLREHPDPTGGLAFDECPHGRADAPRDDELLVGRRDESHERVDAVGEDVLPRGHLAELVGTRRVPHEESGVGRRVDVEEAGRGLLHLPRREAGLLVQAAR